eukprot:CAMPEP_0197031536 /NCGR_PEP_ID=MMETSP1384-20130603/10514_1 /TAXON_ID=29189 /ORGANISM="Ammonia sp." /LENGTH=543 /DNA_ID=CAMNT_0042461077 /DNA_START=113 /DNA_END=1741 /DNA_ORIENTATION=+
MNDTESKPAVDGASAGSPAVNAPDGYPTDEKEQAEMKQKYEAEQRQIDILRSKIQSLRKQRPHSHHKTLKTEYAKYASRMEKQQQSSSSSPPAGATQPAPNSSNADGAADGAGNTRQDKDLRKLHCSLSESKKLSGHGNKVYGCDWNPINANHIVSVGRDGKLIFWNADSGLKRLAYPLDTEFIMTLQYSPDGQHVACGGLDDILSIFPVRDDTGLIKDVEPQIYAAHTGYISSLQYIDSNRMLTASGDATIREWDLEKNTLNASSHNEATYTYRIHREDVMSIHLNPHNANLLLTGSVDSTAKIIDFRIPRSEHHHDEAAMQSSSSQLGSFNGGKNVTHSFYMGYDSDLTSKKSRTTDVNVVKWFPDGHTFVTGCDDGTVRLFDMRSGGILNEYSYHRHYLNADLDDSVHENDAKRNENDSIVRTSTNTHESHKNGANSGGGGDDLDDVKDDQPLKPSDEDPDYFTDEEDPTDGVATLDFSKSGAFMFVSYNNDQHKVLTWNVLTGQVVDELSHSNHVPCLAVSPDGRQLVTACWDHCLKIW